MPPLPDQVRAATGGCGNWQRWFVAIIFAVSILLMVRAACGDLFIDEVISLNKALNEPGWSEIFTRNQTDNNHLLNTLILRALGKQQNLFIYRIPAIVFGAAFLAAMAVVSRRFGKTVQTWVLCLVALSYPVILMSSEARGYMPAMFFAVMAFELLQRCRERQTLWKLLLFWAVLGLGILSHFSFVMVCIALGFWSLAHDHLSHAGVRVIFLNALKFFALPALFVAMLYATYIRHMIILGGLRETRWDAISDVALYLFGFAVEDQLRLLSVLFVLAVVLWGLWKMHKENRDEWIFFAALIFVAPALVLLLWNPTILYYRYFSVCFPFLYLLVACVFAAWFREGGKLKLVPVFLVAAITIGHASKIANLFQFGRGHYKQAVLEMAAATPGSLIKIGSNQDFKNGTLLNFYAQFLPPSKRIAYIPKERRNQERPEWIIECCDDPDFPAFSDIEVGTIGKYDLFAVYPFSGSSGWSWFVYHRSAEAIPGGTNAISPPSPSRQ